MAEEDLGIQLEEWEGSEEKQDAPSISAIEESLMFESKNKILFGSSLFWTFHKLSEEKQSHILRYRWAYTYTLTHLTVKMQGIIIKHNYT